MLTAGSPHQLLVYGQQLIEREKELLNRWACDRPECDGRPHEGWMHKHARATQREPADYVLWSLITGRGFGKTRTGAETSKGWWQKSRRPLHIAVIGKTERETRNICFEGPAGLLNVIRSKYVPRDGYHRSQGDLYLTLQNGTTFRGFSSEKSEALRGYGFDAVWLDEYASWRVQHGLDVWDNMWFALREAREPHVLVTTTPKNLPHVRQAIDQSDHVTRGTLLDNQDNLSDRAIAQILKRYEGTRIGRQELEGELIEDVEGALWSWALINDNRYEGTLAELLPQLWRIVVGVDPAGTKKVTSDETGIVVVGIGGPRHRPHIYVLEDASGRYSPDQWAKMAIVLHDKWQADAVVAEVNNGWDMVDSTLRHQDDRIRVIQVKATRGKYVRAEPIVALYEQERAHHLGDQLPGKSLAKLEDQLTSWTPFDDSGFSPDRLDAMVWAATELTGGPTTQGSFGGAVVAGTTLDPWGGSVVRPM